MAEFETVDEYVGQLPAEVQPVFQQLRATIAAAVPDGVEAITYEMPTLRVGGRNVVHYGAWKRHVAIYPVADLDDADLAAAVAPYRSGKATLKLPLDRPLPYDLVSRIAAELAARRPTGG